LVGLTGRVTGFVRLVSSYHLKTEGLTHAPMRLVDDPEHKSLSSTEVGVAGIEVTVISTELLATLSQPFCEQVAV
jgi:hypothetical protein